MGGSVEANRENLEIVTAGEEGAVPAEGAREPRRRPPPKIAPIATGNPYVSRLRPYVLTSQHRKDPWKHSGTLLRILSDPRDRLETHLGAA